MSEQDNLTPEEFEALNAAGPYNSGVWRGRGVTVTLEESLAGRIENLGALVRQTLIENFSLAEMALMSIADVGCYDGWLIEHLADLPFRRFVGFEPRQRNIDKGKAVRRILRIPSKVEYRQAALDGLGDEKFDIVICTGLLHHVESLGEASTKLAKVCSRLIFIETQCLSEHHEKSLLPEVEPKDIVYFDDEERRIGVIGCKFESDFYDGSAVRSSIVGVPSPGAVEMYLQQAGFGDIKMVMHPSSPWKGDVVERQAKAACFVARCDTKNETRREGVSSTYEEGLAKTSLPPQTIDYLYQRHCLGHVVPAPGQLETYIDEYLGAPEPGRVKAWEHVVPFLDGRFEQEIVKNLRYAPRDKIALEMAKGAFASGRYSDVIEICTTFTTGLNADWRSCYRAFILMAKSARSLGDADRVARYVRLANNAHPAPESIEWGF